MKRWIPVLVVCLAMVNIGFGVPEEAAGEPAPAAEGVKLVVFLPEQIDTEWFWYYYTEISQHLVQAAVEKELIRAGFDVIDLSTVDVFSSGGVSGIQQVYSKEFALPKAQQLGATHLILGRATASKLSQNTAYGVNVSRSSAEITAKLIRVSDGKILVVEDASASAGGQSQKAAGQDALKQAGKDIARKLAAAVSKELAPAE